MTDINLNLPETPQDLKEPEYSRVLEIYNALKQLRQAVESGTGGGGVGPPGPAGPPGADGSPGAPGADGIDGTNGIDGVDGTNGTNGADGADGATGPAGPAPTGTGFAHVIAGVLDAAGIAVDVSSAHITGVLKAAAFPALTGDLTTVAGALATTLATVNAGIGSFTNAAITVNAKGLITAAASGTVYTTTYQIEIVIGDGVNPITTGVYPTGVISLPRSGTLLDWTVLSCDVATPTSGAITFDLWKDTYANYPPTVADSMCGAGIKPNIAATNAKGTGSTFTSWTTTTFAAGDAMFVNVDSVTSLKAAKLILRYTSP